MPEDEPLIVEVRDDGVAWIRFNRPDYRNALDADQWDRLARALGELADNRAVRCLVITGADQVFAAGGDLKRLLNELDEPGGPKAFRDRIHRCLDALYSFPRPTIARVNGAAIGGGLELAIACDIRIAVQSAKWGMPAARFGMVMAVTDFKRLASVVGIDRARFLAITADVISGEEAHRIGLVHELVAEADLGSATERWVGRICKMEPEAVEWFRRAGRALESGDDLGPLKAFEEECLRRLEFRGRVEAFIAK
jgi:enoyl-CoA hydratase/carnithine racemase